MKPTPVRGRCISWDSSTGKLLLRSERGEMPVTASPSSQIQAGAIVEVDGPGGLARVLTPNRSAGGTHGYMDRVLDPRRRKGVENRRKVEAAIREFFLSRDFLETRTPVLVPSPGMEVHIRPFRTETGAYLPTSPEFAMKRLLAGGLERIFQICQAFRLEPESTTHHPEFTMLEWYRAYAGYEDIMRDTEELFEFVARKMFGKPSLVFQGREISVKAPWPRLRVRDLFQEYVGVDLLKANLFDECARLGVGGDAKDTWDDLYFRIWLNCIEPRLPADRAVFVTRYPASQSALAVIDRDKDGSHWARRFEVYAGGLELGNAFEELTDPVEQRRRFMKDMDLREQLYGATFPRTPLDEGFLRALEEGMPPSGGIAMGVDRMVMLFGDEPEIDYTFWLPAVAGAGADE